MVEELSRDEIVEAVARAVTDLLMGAKVLAPPVDAIAIAQNHLRLSDKPRRKSVESAADLSEEQKQWEAALRIGDQLKPDLLRRLGVEPDHPRPMMGESLSKIVAEHLLLPTPWFAKDTRASANDLLTLKSLYTTASHELIAWRWLDLPEPCIVTVVDNDHIRRRRGNACQTRRELHPVEQRCQRYVSEFSRPRFIQAEGWTVQGWPIHRSDWKREILRSVVDVDS